MWSGLYAFYFKFILEDVQYKNPWEYSDFTATNLDSSAKRTENIKAK